MIGRHKSAMDKGTDGLVRFGLSMPAALAEDLDNWRSKRGYTSRSEAVRDLVRDALVLSQWQEQAEDPAAETVGVTILVYNHHTRQLSDHLTEIQHQHHTIAQVALHMHLSPEHCLEVIVLRGPRGEVTALAERLISSRGVLHGKFVPTTTGEGIA